MNKTQTNGVCLGTIHCLVTIVPITDGDGVVTPALAQLHIEVMCRVTTSGRKITLLIAEGNVGALGEQEGGRTTKN